MAPLSHNLLLHYFSIFCALSYYLLLYSGILIALLDLWYRVEWSFWKWKSPCVHVAHIFKYLQSLLIWIPKDGFFFKKGLFANDISIGWPWSQRPKIFGLTNFLLIFSPNAELLGKKCFLDFLIFWFLDFWCKLVHI